MRHSFPNGRVVTVVADRGRKSDKKYTMILFKCVTNESGHVVEAEFGYRRNFWFMDRWGRISRVGNGPNGTHKSITLCELALVTENIHPE